jgi:hypothetical protein
VILDFGGYTISGSAQWGVHIVSAGVSLSVPLFGGNVIVRNGCIRNFAGGGIFFDAAGFNKLNSLLIQCTANAVLDVGSNGNIVDHCTLFSLGTSPTVFLSDARDAIISNCHVECQYGTVAIETQHSYHYTDEIVNNYVTVTNGTPIEAMSIDVVSRNGTYNDGI